MTDTVGSMIGLFCNKTYGAMKNHKHGDDNGDNDGNKDRNECDNAGSGSVSDSSIFDTIATTYSGLDLAEEDQAMATTALQLRCHMYLRVGIYLPYKYPVNSMVNMCHKLLYTKIGVLELCC